MRVMRHDVPVRGLDPAHEGLRVAHLTDVHVGLMTSEKKVREAVELANAAEPDLIVLTGDYVCYSKKFVRVMGDQLSGLRAAAGVVATLGNHDHWTDGKGVARELENDGYRVLRNESIEVRMRGVPLRVTGIDDAVTRHHDLDAAFAHAEDATTICLTHVPDLADAAVRRGAKLVLAGHTHGGQVHSGFTERMYRRITKRRYLSGWYEVGDAVLYVNRGVGTSVVPVRAGHGGKSEVAILTLRRAA